LEIVVKYTLSNEHTMIDPQNWKLPTGSGRIEACGEGEGLVGVLTVDRQTDVRLLAILPEEFKDQQEWIIGEKRGGFFTIHTEIGGTSAYLTCNDEGNLTVGELHPDISVTGMYTRGCQIGMQGPQLCAKPRHFWKLDLTTSRMAFLDLNLHVLQVAKELRALCSTKLHL
jgi:hypothetical protein